MSVQWSGFTEEDLAKIRDDTNSTSATATETSTAAQKIMASPKSVKINNAQTNASQENATNQLKKVEASPKGSPAHVTLKVKENGVFEIADVKQPAAVTSSGTTEPEKSKIDESPVQNAAELRKEKLDLAEFERRQKLIEEQNRIKRDMLRKALDMKKKKTAAEAMKLQQIQEEFSRLNSSLQNDVSILREHIETATAELSEAEKRYDKAEREFIVAKQLLFSKRERKELLTEHLFTIIEQNEMKKAQRLTELMSQLNDDLENSEIL